MPENSRYDVFLSYSEKDKPWVSELVSALRHEGVSAWSDVSLSPGESWQESLEDALRESRTLVVVLTRNSVHSPWTLFELGAAMAGRKKIIPVLAEDGVDSSQIPLSLARFQPLRESSPAVAGKRIAEVLKADTRKD